MTVLVMYLKPTCPLHKTALAKPQRRKVHVTILRAKIAGRMTGTSEIEGAVQQVVSFPGKMAKAGLLFCGGADLLHSLKSRHKRGEIK